MISNFKFLSAKAIARVFPHVYKNKLLRWAKLAGVRQPTVLLSFDCDTGRDAQASLHVQRYLYSKGMSAVYAVPGELLEAYWEDYRKLLDMGGRFVNHGYRCHAQVDAETGKPYSTFSYSGVPEGIWKEDIYLGHETLKRLTGVSPKVFRTPHFGEFNRPEQLENMYEFLSKLGYLVSSSTKPVFGLLNGSAYIAKNNIVELPLSGCLSKPAQLIDSWGFLTAPDACGKEMLLMELEKYAVLFDLRLPVVLNMYFDPADIVNDEDILNALGRFSSARCMDLDNKELLALAK
jgi:peptidoglycan/xylan/chitin deacetylase (PgdA/CDA1 family)